VSQDCKDQQDQQERPDRQVLLALLGVMELMVGMVLMLWAVLLVLSALLVAAVSKAHQGLTERQAPPVRGCHRGTGRSGGAGSTGCRWSAGPAGHRPDLPRGFAPGDLTLNAPGGQVTMHVCLAN
jgi:hypothetical protein